MERAAAAGSSLADDTRDVSSDVWDWVQGSASRGDAAFEDYRLLHSRSKSAEETLQSLQEHFRHITVNKKAFENTFATNKKAWVQVVRRTAPVGAASLLATGVTAHLIGILRQGGGPESEGSESEISVHLGSFWLGLVFYWRYHKKHRRQCTETRWLS